MKKKHIDLSATHLKIVKDTFNRLIPCAEIWVYGSRVKGTSKQVSDLDCVAFLEGEEKQKKYLIQEAFEESDLPFRVDFFIWEDIPENFHSQIKESHIVLQEGKS